MKGLSRMFLCLQGIFCFLLSLQRFFRFIALPGCSVYNERKRSMGRNGHSVNPAVCLMEGYRMNFQLERPEAVVSARESKRGMNWFLEILVFIVVFFLCMFAQSICAVPIDMLRASAEADYKKAVALGDMEKIAEATYRIGNMDLYTALSLISTLAMILVTLLFCRLIQKRKPATLGFTRKGAGREYLIGAAAGFVMFSAAVLLCVLTGALRIEGFSATFKAGTFGLFLIGYVIQGMGEEVLCRGYVMVSIGRRYSMWAAVFSNAFLFAALHLLNTGIGVLAFVNLVLFGVFASLYFIKRGNIWGIGALHSIWNLVQGNFWGLRVSGMTTECSVFRSTMMEGKSVINGGAFGPEGGLAVTVILLAGVCLLLRKKAF